MACNDKKRKDLDYIRIMAGHYANLEEEDVQIYKETKAGVGKLYYFETINKERPYVVEIVKFQRNKSKDVLRNTGKRKSGTPKKAKSKNTTESNKPKVVSDSGQLLPEDGRTEV